MKMVRLYIDPKLKKEPLIEMESPSLTMFVAQTAANLLASSRGGYPSDEIIPEKDPVGYILASRLSWAHHGFTNALVSQADFLYAVVETSVRMRMPVVFQDRLIASLITEALEAFQIWKTNLIKVQKERHGEDWGDATKFNHMD
jgi:hypothetical protein